MPTVADLTVRVRGESSGGRVETLVEFQSRRARALRMLAYKRRQAEEAGQWFHGFSETGSYLWVKPITPHGGRLVLEVHDARARAADGSYGVTLTLVLQDDWVSGLVPVLQQFAWGTSPSI